MAASCYLSSRQDGVVSDCRCGRPARERDTSQAAALTQAISCWHLSLLDRLQMLPNLSTVMSPCGAALAAIRLRRLLRTAVVYDGLAGADASLRQLQVGLGDVPRLSDPPTSTVPLQSLPRFASHRNQPEYGSC